MFFICVYKKMSKDSLARYYPEKIEKTQGKFR